MLSKKSNLCLANSSVISLSSPSSLQASGERVQRSTLSSSSPLWTANGKDLNHTSGSFVSQKSVVDNLNQGRQREMVRIHYTGPHLSQVVPEFWNINF